MGVVERTAKNGVTTYTVRVYLGDREYGYLGTYPDRAEAERVESEAKKEIHARRSVKRARAAQAAFRGRSSPRRTRSRAGAKEGTQALTGAQAGGLFSRTGCEEVRTENPAGSGSVPYGETQTERHDGDVSDFWLYRIYGADDDLLYIGITADGPRRFRRHGNERSWWPAVQRIEVEHHPTRDAALRAEREAIAQEHPRHNGVLLARDESEEPGVTTLYRRCRKCGEHYTGRHCTCPQSTARAREIERLWNEGRSPDYIAGKVGISRDYLMHLMSKLRADGYDLPYRRTSWAAW